MSPDLEGPQVLTDPVRDLTRWAKGTRATAEEDAAAALHHLGAMRLPALQRMAAVDRIGAAARAGELARALAQVEELARFAAAINRPWALAALDFGRALTAEPAQAAELFEQALGRAAARAAQVDLAESSRSGAW